MNVKSDSTPSSSVPKDDDHDDDILAKVNIKMFSYKELVTATNGFSNRSLIGEGGFGPVFKGTLQSTGQIVAIKMLDTNGLQGHKEWLMEVLTLSTLHHPNIIDLIGCCNEGAHRLLVYEYMPLGSLNEHLHDDNHVAPLDWNTKILIVYGVAKALDYLHNEARPTVLYRDLKPDNILLGEGFNPKISDFGIAMFDIDDDEDKSSILNYSVMGTRAYSAPEFCNARVVTTKSDVYSFGVVLLELITGREALNVRREKHYIADWVDYKLRNGEDIANVADTQMNGEFPVDKFRKVLNMGLKCTEDDPKLRPSMNDVVHAMDELKPHVPLESGRGGDQDDVTYEPNFSSPETKLGASLWERKAHLNTNPYE